MKPNLKMSKPGSINKVTFLRAGVRKYWRIFLYCLSILLVCNTSHLMGPHVSMDGRSWRDILLLLLSLYSLVLDAAKCFNPLEDALTLSPNGLSVSSFVPWRCKTYYWTSISNLKLTAKNLSYNPGGIFFDLILLKLPNWRLIIEEIDGKKREVSLQDLDINRDELLDLVKDWHQYYNLHPDKMIEPSPNTKDDIDFWHARN